MVSGRQCELCYSPRVEDVTSFKKHIKPSAPGKVSQDGRSWEFNMAWDGVGVIIEQSLDGIELSWCRLDAH